MSGSNFYAALMGLARVGAGPGYSNALANQAAQAALRLASNGERVSVPVYVKLHYDNNNLATQTWARLTWRERFDAWLQDDSHVPNSLTWPDVIEYRVGKFSVTPWTLCQLVDTRKEKI